jgi:hypothetical protein
MAGPIRCGSNSTAPCPNAVLSEEKQHVSQGLPGHQQGSAAPRPETVRSVRIRDDDDDFIETEFQEFQNQPETIP